MSTKTVAQKLLVKPGTALWISDRERLELLGELPADVALHEAPQDADVWVMFAENARSLSKLLERWAESITSTDKLWVAYPKGNRADINRDKLWPMVARYGMRPISQVAIDEVWSALRFRPLKEGEAQFSGGQPRD